MLLRSSSTPVLGSLLPSNFSDSPNNNTHHSYQSLNKYPFGCHNLSTINSCNSSPSIAEFSDDYHSSRGLRRAQSEDNLQGHVFASCNSNTHEDFQPSTQSKKLSGRQKWLETIPSSSRGRSEEEEEEEEGYDDDREIVDEEDIGLSSKMEKMVLIEQVGVLERGWSNVGFEEERGFNSEEMYLARGLGIDGGSNYGNGGGSAGGRGGGEFYWAGGDGGDIQRIEEFYKKMVQENPGNHLFLRNYAQFLHQTKRDLQGAEEYYSRAILADPKDGDILSQYAKLIWELHRDLDKASSYFERAVQASPEDSHVHAEYACFLWETEEDGDAYAVKRDSDALPPHFHGVMASTSA